MKLNYNKCKHCKYFTQHYNIEYNHIYKVCCGHCTKNVSDTGFRLYSGKQPCPYFEQNNGQIVKTKKHQIVDLIKEMTLSMEYIKLFLNKNKPKQEIGDIMIDKLK